MTTKMPLETYLRYWKEAQAQEVGLEILTPPDDQTKLLNALYACRQEFGGFEGLMVFQPQPPGTIWIAHRDAELPE
jgi:hypothetical protein